MRIVFLGPPGSGKGTQSALLVRKLRIPHLSTGDMLRRAREDGTELGKHADAYMSRGELVPDAIVLGLISERLDEPDCQAGCLFDGFPRTVQQAESLDQLLAERRTPLDLVLALEVEEDELSKRLTQRGRDDDKPDVIRERFKTYVAQTRPLFKYYSDRKLLAAIDGTGTPDEVFARIENVLMRCSG
ncbi:MAG: adenylate kinase [Pirellulales bacterium]